MDSLCFIFISIASLISKTLAGTDCLTPSSPTYGVVSVNTTASVFTATYTCDWGYTMIGDVTRECGQNQTWTGTDPECMAYLPDLVPEPAFTTVTLKIEDRKLTEMVCALEEGCASSSAFDIRPNSTEWTKHKRILMRFTTSSWNFGMTSFSPPRDRSLWEWHECHDHFHSIENFAQYDILNSAGEMAAEGHKASYCLADTTCIANYRKLHRCETVQGISVGCTDIYTDKTDCQWIDMTDVLPGNYTFQTHVNPERITPELNYDNNVINCDIYFDGNDVEVDTCILGGTPFGGSCMETSDCSYGFAQCINQSCGCQEGYRESALNDWYTSCTVDCDPDENYECYNGGTRSCTICLECTSFASYECECPYGYKGVKCELEYDPDDCKTYAARRYCKNKSQCVDGIEGFTCNCTGTGYTGPMCSESLIPTNYCLDDPCGYLFICTSREGGYNCTCDGTLHGTVCLARAPISGTGKLLPSLVVVLVMAFILH